MTKPIRKYTCGDGEMLCHKCLNEAYDWAEMHGTGEETAPVECAGCGKKLLVEFCPHHKVWYETLCERCEAIDLPLRGYCNRKLR